MPLDLLGVRRVEYHQVPVTAQAEPFDQEERESISLPHMHSAEFVSDAHYAGA